MCGHLNYFNPRSREGSDLSVFLITGYLPISIHAPAKGATIFMLFFVTHVLISIHAPAKGATD